MKKKQKIDDMLKAFKVYKSEATKCGAVIFNNENKVR
jgi:hypothetical protein